MGTTGWMEKTKPYCRLGEISKGKAREGRWTGRYKDHEGEKLRGKGA